jgi:hypothetical protein
MKRMRIMGLCLVVAFAMSAVAATSAFATAPEFGRCVAKAGGKFSDSGCTKEVASKGKFEWEPGAGAKNTFTSKMNAGTLATLETVKGTKITCKEESSPGEIKNAKEVAGVVAKFNGCETSGLKCSSAGKAEGEIVTASLEGVVGVEKVGLKPSANKLAEELHAPAGSKVATFSCAGVPVEVKGSVLHPITANKMLSTSTEKFSAAKGEQKPDKFAGEGVDAHILESNTAGGEFEEAGQTITSTVTFGEKIEVNSVV